jgi:hypothetical protein
LPLCSEREGVVEQEAACIEALRDAASYRVTDDRLEIADASGETTLVLERGEQAASTDHYDTVTVSILENDYQTL